MPRSTGSKNSIAFAPSDRYGRLASRKWTAGSGQAAQLDLARDLLDQLVAAVVGQLDRRAHRSAGAGGSGVTPRMVRHAGMSPRGGAKVGGT